MAAGVRERVPPLQLSIFACAASVVIGTLIWWAGLGNPSVWTNQMTVMHHRGYGPFNCRNCHQPVPHTMGMATSITCWSSGCHTELLKPMKPTKELVEGLKTGIYGDKAWPNEARAREYLAIHRASESEKCISCHKEHIEGEPRRPDDAKWKPLVNADASTPGETDWVSVSDSHRSPLEIARGPQVELPFKQ